MTAAMLDDPEGRALAAAIHERKRKTAMTTTDQLAAIEARAEAATDGPWETHDGDVVQSYEIAVKTGEHSYEREGIIPGEYVRENDAEFIARARTDIPTLLAMVREQRAAIERVKALHVREVLAVHEGYGEEAWCPNCRVHWPCEDYAALTATEGAE